MSEVRGSVDGAIVLLCVFGVYVGRGFDTIVVLCLECTVFFVYTSFYIVDQSAYRIS